MEDQIVTGEITGELTYLPGHLSHNVVIQTPEKSKLRLFVNADGKVDAEYDPEDLTEAALLLVAELRRLGEG